MEKMNLHVKTLNHWFKKGLKIKEYGAGAEVYCGGDRVADFNDHIEAEVFVQIIEKYQFILQYMSVLR